MRITKEAHSIRGQETKEGGRDVQAKKKGSIWIW